MSENICIVGTGKIGLITAIGLADLGHNIIVVDKSRRRIDLLKSGRSPDSEPGVDEYLQKLLKSDNLVFTSRIDEAIENSGVVIIAVGTPEGFDGQPNMTYVTDAVHSIAENMKHYKVLVTMSTVPVGTNRKIEKYLRKRCPHIEFDIVSNPKFLRTGKSLEDFFNPDRLILGCSSHRARLVLMRVYRVFHDRAVPFLWCTLETAELIKYASSAFLATKITFINQLANLSEKVGADVSDIALALGLDGRIGAESLHVGPGYGGSNFSSETRALTNAGDKCEVDMSLIREVIDANERQKKRVVNRLEELVGSYENKTVAVLGLAFKTDSANVSESPAITIVNELLFRGATVAVHDPMAMNNFKKHFPYITYNDDPILTCVDADILIIATGWEEYKSLNPQKLREVMMGNIIYDSRNILLDELFTAEGFLYLGTGREICRSIELAEKST